MKRILILLCLPIIYSLLLFTGCSSGVNNDNPTPDLKNILTGNRWMVNTLDEGVYFNEDGKLYLTETCKPDTRDGNWSLEDNIITHTIFDGPLEIIEFWEVYSFTSTTLSISLAQDSGVQVNMVYNLTEEDVYGCTDSTAANYDPAATCDDGSCLTVYGCMDSTALNYNPAAVQDDGSCQYSADITIYLDVSGAYFLDSLGCQLVNMRINVNGVHYDPVVLSAGLGFISIPPCYPPDPDAANFSLEWQNSSEAILYVEFLLITTMMEILPWTQVFYISANDCLTIGLSEKDNVLKAVSP